MGANSSKDDSLQTGGDQVQVQSSQRYGVAEQCDGHPTVVIRSGSRGGSPIVGKIPNGTVVILFHEAVDSVKIQVPETGLEGWAKRSNIQDQATACGSVSVGAARDYVRCWSRAHEGLGELAEAEAVCRRALQRAPQQAELHQLLGNVLLDRGDHAGAEASFRKAIQLEPDRIAAHKYLGRMKMAQGEMTAAKAAWQEVVRLEPESADNNGLLALAHKGLGELAEAEAVCRQALQLAPQQAKLHMLLGNVLRERGNHDGAEACFRKAIQLEPDRIHAHWSLGYMKMDQGEMTAAKAAFQEVVRLEPERADNHATLALAHKGLGELAEAEAVLHQALQLAPQQAGLHMQLGDVLFERGDHDGAEASFRDALIIDPMNIDAQVGMGRLKQFTGDLAGASASFEAALRLKPQSCDALTHRSLLKKEQCDLEGAEDDLSKALAIHSTPVMFEMRARLRIDLNQKEAAINDYDSALRLAPEHPVYLQRRAAVKAALGRTAEAREDLAAAHTSTGILLNWRDLVFARRDMLPDEATNKRSLMYSPFALEYRHAVAPQTRRELQDLIREVIAMDGAADRETFATTLVEEMNQHSEDAVDVATERLWTSYKKNINGQEFCSILNGATRFEPEDITAALAKAAPAARLARSLNRCLLVNRSKASGFYFPPTGRTLRGGGLPHRHVPFFQKHVGKKVRIPCFWPTAAEATDLDITVAAPPGAPLGLEVMDRGLIVVEAVGDGPMQEWNHSKMGDVKKQVVKSDIVTQVNGKQGREAIAELRKKGGAFKITVRKATPSTSYFFMRRAMENGNPAVLWEVHFDPRGHAEHPGHHPRYVCQHVNLIKTKVDGLPEEHEYLFVPYSTFSIDEVILPSGSHTADNPIRIVVTAACDNSAEAEDLPLTPWS